MTPDQITEARALVERLDALAAKATPMDIGTAEIVQDEGYFECAVCNGNGETWGNGYLNIDGIALNVQFSGIGREFKDNEHFVMALIEAYRSGALTAALDEIERLRDALDLIATHRAKCHAYDDDMGHPRRIFDAEDLKLVEYAAQTALKGAGPMTKTVINRDTRIDRNKATKSLAYAVA